MATRYPLSLRRPRTKCRGRACPTLFGWRDTIGYGKPYPYEDLAATLNRPGIDRGRFPSMKTTVRRALTVATGLVAKFLPYDER